jgi:hypothetical protein
MASSKARNRALKVLLLVGTVLCCASMVNSVALPLFTIKCSATRIDLEMRALAGAAEFYKADHGHYPTGAASDRLRPNRDSNPQLYIASARMLYRQLSGDLNGNQRLGDPEDGKPYFEFLTRRDMLRGWNDTLGPYVVDPWGSPYGYSTLKAKHQDSPDGNNYTFDLWSTGGGESDTDRKRWVTNWK